MPRLLLLAALAAALPVQAQITISRADVAQLLTRTGTVTSGSADASPALQALADRSGANQTWDFSAISFAADVPVPTRPTAEPVPGSDLPDLAGASHVVAVGEGEESAYLFFRLTDTAYEALGVSSMVDVEGQPFRLTFSFAPGKLLFPLPLTAGASWTSTDTLRMGGFEGDEFFAVETITASVEGWGTVVTSAGSFSALKLRRRTETAAYLDGQPVDVTVEDGIEFVAPGNIEVSIALDGTTVIGAFQSVVQTSVASGPPAAAGDLRLTLQGANPSRAGAAVAVAFAVPSAGTARLEVTDALGRQVAVLHDGAVAVDGRATWRTDGLPAGVYALRLTAGGRHVTERVTLVR